MRVVALLQRELPGEHDLRPLPFINQKQHHYNTIPTPLVVAKRLHCSFEAGSIIDNTTWELNYFLFFRKSKYGVLNHPCGLVEKLRANLEKYLLLLFVQ